MNTFENDIDAALSLAIETPEMTPAPEFMTRYLDALAIVYYALDPTLGAWTSDGQQHPELEALVRDAYERLAGKALRHPCSQFLVSPGVKALGEKAKRNLLSLAAGRAALSNALDPVGRFSISDGTQVAFAVAPLAAAGPGCLILCLLTETKSEFPRLMKLVTKDREAKLKTIQHPVAGADRMEKVIH